MGQRGKRRGRRAVAVLALVLGVAGAWVAVNYESLQTRYAAHRLTTAATDEERSHWADRLAARGDAGLMRLVEIIRAGDPPSRAAAANTLARHLNDLPDGDPRAVQLGGQLLATFDTCDEPGRAVLLELLPHVLKQTGAAHAVKSREVIAAGLQMAAIEPRLLAIRLAMHPEMRMRAEVLPLLYAPEPEVRRVALFAVGPATDDDVVIGDEELFRWLHDPDADVRKICRDALISRGRIEPEISLGRRLTHPDPRERLELLADLRYDHDVPDPEPWLERLSRDPERAVRAGAVRTMLEVAAERRLPAPAWVARIADADPDPTVRQIAGFYRSLPGRTDPGIRRTGGP